MKNIKLNSISQLQRELSSIDLQKMLMDRAKNAVLQTAIELME